MAWILLFARLATAAPPSAPPSRVCECTCVVREGEELSTRKAQGKDREEAGEALKKKLGKRKCELSPVCKGSC